MRSKLVKNVEYRTMIPFDGKGVRSIEFAISVHPTSVMDGQYREKFNALEKLDTW